MMLMNVRSYGQEIPQILTKIVLYIVPPSQMRPGTVLRGSQLDYLELINSVPEMSDVTDALISC